MTRIIKFCVDRATQPQQIVDADVIQRRYRSERYPRFYDSREVESRLLGDASVIRGRV